MTELEEHWRRWIGRTKEASEAIEPMRACAMQATLDDDGEPLKQGDPLPPLWHWLYFWEPTPHSALSADGHSARGQFLPPINLPRRAIAGGRIKFLRPLTIGAAATRRSRVSDIKRKTGRSGRLVFVTLQHETADEQGPCIQEEQDLVFRAAGKPGEPLPAGERGPAVVRWRHQVEPDPLLLFRYSALTFNGHRIHYQQSYATEEEGYSGLVVHGSLLATMMAALVCRQVPDQQITWLDFRAVRPVFDTQPFNVGGRPSEDGQGAEVWVTDAGGYLAMTGNVKLA